MCNLKTILVLHVFILTCLGKQHVFEHAHSRVPTKSNKNSTHLPTLAFQCTSGQRIDGSKECDGKADCLDASDETEKCHKIKCLSSWFVCDYGACIPGNYECDGKIDCRDASDEYPNICMEKERGSCKLPQQPKFGNWTILSNIETPKKYVPKGTVLKVECDDGYKLDGMSALYCTNGQWSSEMSQCLRTCPSRVSTEVIRVTCVYKNKELGNCTDPVEGTLATFYCFPPFEYPKLEKRPVHLCKNGTWNQEEPRCVKV